MKKIFVSSLLCLMLFVTLAGAKSEKNFNVQVGNTTGQSINYSLYWVDHDQRDKLRSPALVVLGQLKPGNIQESVESYKPGIYKFIWGYVDKSTRYSREISVGKDIRTVLLNVHDTRPGEIRVDFLERKD
jgi:hypothetical protein